MFSPYENYKKYASLYEKVAVSPIGRMKDIHSSGNYAAYQCDTANRVSNYGRKKNISHCPLWTCLNEELNPAITTQVLPGFNG